MHFTARYGIEDPKKKNEMKIKKKKNPGWKIIFGCWNFKKNKKYHFFVDLFFDFFLGSEQIFQIIFGHFFLFSFVCM